MSRIVSLTLNPALDKSSTIDHVVAERKLRCGPPTFDPGGGGINVARAVHQLGGDAIAVWTCGGPIGELLRRMLDQESISHRPIPIDAITRENLVIFEESSGRQFRFGMPGAPLTEAEVQTCIDALLTPELLPDYLVLSGSLPPSVDPALYARFAKAMPASCKVILDTSGTPLQLGIEAGVFMIKPNVAEFAHLAGATIEDDSHIQSVAQSLIEAGKVTAVLTSLGSGGAAFSTAEGFEHIRAPMVEIRSKIGAGDSTVGGMALALTRGLSLNEAARFGIAAGSAAVMTDGTQLCRRQDTERLYAQMCQVSS